MPSQERKQGFFAVSFPVPTTNFTVDIMVINWAFQVLSEVSLYSRGFMPATVTTKKIFLLSKNRSQIRFAKWKADSYTTSQLFYTYLKASSFMKQFPSDHSDLFDAKEE